MEWICIAKIINKSAVEQIVKLLKIFYDMTTFDIFFIDFERPKYHNSDHFFQGSNKSHPGTPSITSSFKPTISSPSPTNECVSAWRNYFIANEWQELMTKRKISIHLHIVFVIGALMVCISESFTLRNLNICSISVVGRWEFRVVGVQSSLQPDAHAKLSRLVSSGERRARYRQQ